ncbi:alpha-glucosidase/alpha-galactosidase [Synoicihabitans lomoniglobus]|uniref:Alpha-glucosidase/alpha-galactosidase n=1 Tax=Synoicihabitans lomoniglobus TaxID=2909285 RepID=A0AAF0CQ14_9BACT|nr:alpha-glucosidase/alpha-galactosidase [Opitutaceae bacterium LMO-M01]WED65963.1 alpha-glucosidase/alpha-galactosidase [Opitutaceae bacterium LMO-M01]
MPKIVSSTRGHDSHTHDAVSAGLSGEMSRPVKLTFVGAGSFFAPRLINDVIKIPGNRDGTIALVDIDAKRLALTARLVRKLVKTQTAERWKVVASTERRAVLSGTDYLVNCIEVSGLDCVLHDNDIPLKYGIDQCIGDTIGPGGLFKALRTIPVWLGVLRDCEELCPQVVVLNYTNPMAMMCLAAGRTSSLPVVGLCHSVQGTSQLLADYAGVPIAEMNWDCAGINHLAWFTRLEHAGVDLYADRLYQKFRDDLAAAEIEHAAGNASHDATDVKGGKEANLAYTARDLVRKDMCLHFGAFITESSGHLSEYLPYYRKSDAGRALLRQGYDGGSRFYATNWPQWRDERDRERRDMLAGRMELGWARSWEYASWIIEAREKDTPFRIHGNVMNQAPGGGGALITNLPADGCVEVACMIDGNGVHPTRYGALPRHLAAVCASNMGFFDVGAQAAIEQSVELAIQALYLDPLTAAVCTPSQIRAMGLEMFQAEQAHLPGYR